LYQLSFDFWKRIENFPPGRLRARARLHRSAAAKAGEKVGTGLAP
jgi:hypothetical protein